MALKCFFTCADIFHIMMMKSSTHKKKYIFFELCRHFRRKLQQKKSQMFVHLRGHLPCRDDGRHAVQPGIAATQAVAPFVVAPVLRPPALALRDAARGRAGRLQAN